METPSVVKACFTRLMVASPSAASSCKKTTAVFKRPLVIFWTAWVKIRSFPQRGD